MDDELLYKTGKVRVGQERLEKWDRKFMVHVVQIEVRYARRWACPDD